MSAVNPKRTMIKMTATLGKSEARDKFLPLVDELASHGGIIEITARGKPVAVLMSHTDYLMLRARGDVPATPKRTLVGSFELIGDLDEATKQVSELMRKAIERGASEL